MCVNGKEKIKLSALSISPMGRCIGRWSPLAELSVYWYNKVMPSPASALTNKIIDFIYRHGGYAWRASSVGIYDQTKRAYRTAPKRGVSDILACFQGQLIAIEIKIGKDRLSPEQTGFLENVSAVGGNTFVASDFADFEKWWDQQYPCR